MVKWHETTANPHSDHFAIKGYWSRRLRVNLAFLKIKAGYVTEIVGGGTEGASTKTKAIRAAREGGTNRYDRMNQPDEFSDETVNRGFIVVHADLLVEGVGGHGHPVLADYGA